MTTASEQPVSTCVVAVLDGDTVLVTPLGVLPEIADNRWPTPGELLVVAPGARAIQIAPTSLVSDEPRVTFHVFATVGGTGTGNWVSVAEVASPELRDVVQSIDDPPERRPDWFRLGWFDEALDWIDGQLVELGMRRTGSPDVIKNWSLSVVLEIPIDPDSKVYFKATCQCFGAEPVITALLAELFPEVVTRVLAFDGTRSWMLMAPLPGAVGADDADNTVRLAEIAVTVANLQIGSIKHLPDLIAAGCTDRTLLPTSQRLQEVVHSGFELLLLSDSERAKLLELLPQMLIDLTAFAECGIPWTLVHGDLHAGNVTHSPTGHVIFDWTDACISHPFLDLVLLASQATDPATVQSAYLNVWRETYPNADVDRAWALAPRIDRMFQAITYEGIQQGQEVGSVWELGGVQANCLRQLLTSAVGAGNR